MFPRLLSFSSPAWQGPRVSSQAFDNVGTVDTDRNDFLLLLVLENVSMYFWIIYNGTFICKCNSITGIFHLSHLSRIIFPMRLLLI